MKLNLEGRCFRETLKCAFRKKLIKRMVHHNLVNTITKKMPKPKNALRRLLRRFSLSRTYHHQLLRWSIYPKSLRKLCLLKAIKQLTSSRISCCTSLSSLVRRVPICSLSNSMCSSFLMRKYWTRLMSTRTSPTLSMPLTP